MTMDSAPAAPERVGAWRAAGALFLLYAFLGNYVALPGYKRYLARGGTSASGAELDLAVWVGASKMILWMFSFQLGVLCLAMACLSSFGRSTRSLRRGFAAIALCWLGVWSIPALPGPYPVYFASMGALITCLIARALWRTRAPSVPASTSDGWRAHAQLFSLVCFAIATWDVCGLGSVGRILYPEQALQLDTRSMVVAQTTKLSLELAVAWFFAGVAINTPAGPSSPSAAPAGSARALTRPSGCPP